MVKVTETKARELYTALGAKAPAERAALQKNLNRIHKMEGLDEATEDLSPKQQSLLESILEAIDAEENVVVVADEPSKNGKGAPAKKGVKAAEPDDDEGEDADEDEEASEEAEEDETDEEEEAPEEDEDETDETEDEEDEDVKPTKKKAAAPPPAKGKGGTAVKTPPKKAPPKNAKGEKIGHLGKDGKKVPPQQPQKKGVIWWIVKCLLDASKQKPVSKDQIVKVLVKKFPEREEKAMRSTVNSQIPSGLRVEKNVEVKSNENGYWLSEKPKNWSE